jgi:hypothetical protein
MPRDRLSHTGWGMLSKVRFNTRAVVRQLTLAPMKGHLWKFCDAALAVRVEVAIEGRFGHGAQAPDLGRFQPLTLQVECLHFALHPRVRMVKSPGLQRFPLSCGKLDLLHRRAPLVERFLWREKQLYQGLTEVSSHPAHGIDAGEPVPVLGKDLFEDIPGR